jgi:hypothetical protein
MLTFLATGMVYSEQPANKPYKVCPDVVTAKDTPCKVATPTAAIVHRIEIPKQKESELEAENKSLSEIIKTLTQQLEKIEKDTK